MLCASRRTLPLGGAKAVRAFSVMAPRREGLRIGFVPEHFSTPLHFAHKHYGLNADLVPYPSGTGHMIESLRSSEIDVGVGLTEGWVAGLGKHGPNNAGYKLVGTYVETPLCWAISAGVNRDDVVDVEGLRGKRIGVSRIGSGSYVMGFVLADKYGWLQRDGQTGKPQLPFEPVPLQTFAKLRDSVNQVGSVPPSEFFMWEHFTSKRYYDNNSIKKIGEIYTPWSSWKIVARDPTDKRLQTMSDAINKGIKHFEENQDEAIQYISTELDYSEEDAREWLKTVKFSQDVKGVDPAVISRTIEILSKAGVIESKSEASEDMVAIKRAAKGKS